MASSSARPEVVNTVSQLRKAVASARAAGRRIGLAPTMGALHEGHLSLVRAAKSECGYAVVSIYVNPTQFGPREDFGNYPRTLEADLDALAGCNTDLVFAPDSAQMYAPGHDTWVDAGAVAGPLEGIYRPGHFRGVATVVLKLLNMVLPDVAYFGQKDYQQAQVIRRLVADLNVPVELRICPTVREPDGLAMSSRNRYLSPAERRQALVLWESLSLAQSLVRQGQRSAAAIVAGMRQAIARVPQAKIDYVALVDPDTLEPVATVAGRAVALVAVRIGATRLIDNVVIEVN